MGDPVRIYIVSEIILDEGSLPAGVRAETVQDKVDEVIWGTVVPVLKLKATKERGKKSRLHVHNSNYERSCSHCMTHAQDEENADNA